VGAGSPQARGEAGRVPISVAASHRCAYIDVGRLFALGKEQVPVEKIDAFCHTMPRPYFDRFFALEATPAAANIRRRVSNIPSLVDMEVRFAQMDEFADYRQVINIAAPPVEDLGSKQISKEMARVGNEALCELVAKHPDRFAGFIACVPMDDTDAAIAEAEYACTQLGAGGVQIYTHVHGHPMDEERFEPFYARMAQLDKIVQVHPCRNAGWADYPSEQRQRPPLAGMVSRPPGGTAMPINRTVIQVVEDFSAVVVAAGSRIATVKDLPGKTIAVNTLKNVNEIVLKSYLESHGVEPTALKYTELGFPDMLAAITQHRVDAAPQSRLEPVRWGQHAGLLGA
jgi:hypothetical protein